jgi:hypothetical protein
MCTQQALGWIAAGLVGIALTSACSVYDNKRANIEKESAGTGGERTSTGDSGTAANDSGALGGAGGNTGNSGGAGSSGQTGTIEGCGDGRVTGNEQCDTAIASGKPGACPTACSSQGNCLIGVLEGSGCSTKCGLKPPECKNGDGCCPTGCNTASDSDCSASCGDGTVQADAGESCEPASALTETSLSDAGIVCPAKCEDDGNPCTSEVFSGSPDTCNAKCTHVAITAIAQGDGCCTPGANANTDSDCGPVCGNGIREASEECDGVVGCDTQCKSSLTPEQRSCVETYNYANAGDACDICMCTNCREQFIACYGSSDQTRNADCAKLVSCGYQNRCLGRICYCGTAATSSDGYCLTGANGPCKQVIEQVTNATSVWVIAAQEGDPNTALGAARTLSNCFESQCLDICFK